MKCWPHLTLSPSPSCSGNVVGYKPYEVGKPSCSTYGMKPSSRYQGLCAAPGASPAVAANSVYGGNTIETYEYSFSSNSNNNNNNNNNINNNHNKANTPNRNHNNPSNQYPSPKFPTQAAPSPVAAAAAAPSSFRSQSRGGQASFTMENNQQQQHQSGRYKHKLEAYRPSAAEFEKSVQKHTILRTYIEQATKEQQQEQYQQQQQQQETGPESTVTQKPIRGWSLLTWRG